MQKYCLIAFVALFIVACNQPIEPSGKQVFHYNEPKTISSLDPAFAKNMANSWVVNMLFNGLVQFDSNLAIQPSIAKTWEISEDGLNYRFLLRTDISFHNDEAFKSGQSQGRKVIASDFVYSFKRILSPKTASPGRWVFANVDTSSGKGLEALNDSELVIRLQKPFPPFLGILAMGYCSVVPEEAVKKYGNDFRNHPVGTGPFQYFLWKENVKLVLHRNENYFEKDKQGKKLPYLDAVSITFVSDAQSSFMAFLQGRTDFLNGLDDGSYKDAILTRKGELKPELKASNYLIRSPFLNTEYLGFLVTDTGLATKGSPVKSKDFRQAVNYALDRRKMLRYIRNGVGIAGEAGLVPPSLFDSDTIRKDYMPKYGYSFNPEKSKQLLKKCGYLDKMGRPEVKLFITSQYTDLCEFIQHQLEDVGLKVKLEVNPPSTHADLVAKSQAPFFRKSWIADYPDAENYLSLLYGKNFTPNGPNYTLYNSDIFNQLYQTAMGTNSLVERNTYYRKMDSLAVQDAPVVVLFYDESLRFVSKKVSGLGSNPMNMLDLKRVKVKR